MMVMHYEIFKIVGIRIDNFSQSSQFISQRDGKKEFTMSLLKGLVILMVFPLLFLIGPGCGGGGPCQINDDCLENELCMNGKCEPIKEPPAAPLLEH
jgi:hypothetical protein